MGNLMVAEKVSVSDCLSKVFSNPYANTVLTISLQLSLALRLADSVSFYRAKLR